MCEKAHEIQTLRASSFHFCNGDFFVIANESGLRCYHTFSSESIMENYIWLPRQDQLQEMMYITNGGGYMLTKLIDAFYSFVKNELIAKQPVHGLEKCWLMFVMKEKYGQVWDFQNKDWFYKLDLDTLKAK